MVATMTAKANPEPGPVQRPSPLEEARARLREAEAAAREGLTRLQALSDEQQEVENKLRAAKATPIPTDGAGIRARLDEIGALETERRRLGDLYRGATQFAGVARERAREAGQGVGALEREAAWLRGEGVPDAERAIFKRLVPIGEWLQAVQMLKWSLQQDVAELRARRARLAVLEGRAEEPDRDWPPRLQRLAAIADEMETLKAEVEAAMRRGGSRGE